jgi:hypothetical protein
VENVDGTPTYPASLVQGIQPSFLQLSLTILLVQTHALSQQQGSARQRGLTHSTHGTRNTTAAGTSSRGDSNTSNGSSSSSSSSSSSRGTVSSVGSGWFQDARSIQAELSAVSAVVGSKMHVVYRQ